MTAREDLESLIGDQADDMQDDRESTVRLKRKCSPKPSAKHAHDRKRQRWGYVPAPGPVRAFVSEKRDEVQPWEGRPDLLPKRPPGAR